MDEDLLVLFAYVFNQQLMDTSFIPQIFITVFCGTLLLVSARVGALPSVCST